MKKPTFLPIDTSVANKYYSSTGHLEQKNKKTTGQIKFLASHKKTTTYKTGLKTFST